MVTNSVCGRVTETVGPCMQPLSVGISIQAAKDQPVYIIMIQSTIQKND